MSLTDPATGAPLANDAIQRVLFICHPVHVYAIPPLMSLKGHTAADWTAPDPRNEGKTSQIFTARLRILETATPLQKPGAADQEQVKTDILLEDPSTGSLFAAAPYTDEGAVEHAVDSSRFFALRVIGDGKKAVLGIGFEDRSEAFDFGVTLQEARKVLGFGTAKPAATSESPPQNAPQRARGAPAPAPAPAAGGQRGPPLRGPGGRNAIPGNVASRTTPQKPSPVSEPAEKPATPKDYSLKPGQTITVDLGKRRPAASNSDDTKDSSSPITTTQDENKALFSIAPPPSSSSFQNEDGSPSAFPLIPPPPGAREARPDGRRRPPPTTSVEDDTKPPDDNAFDDEFGDFQ